MNELPLCRLVLICHGWNKAVEGQQRFAYRKPLFATAAMIKIIKTANNATETHNSPGTFGSRESELAEGWVSGSSPFPKGSLIPWWASTVPALGTAALHSRHSSRRGEPANPSAQPVGGRNSQTEFPTTLAEVLASIISVHSDADDSKKKLHLNHSKALCSRHPNPEATLAH